MTIKEFEIQLALGLLTDEMKLKVAKNLNTPKEVLTILSTDKYWLVRCWVAFNPNTPKEALTKLSIDEDWQVKKYAIENLGNPDAVKGEWNKYDKE